MNREKEVRTINGRRYVVHIASFFTHTTVKVADSRYLTASADKFVTKRKLLCDDDARFAAKVLDIAVSKREDKIERQEQHEKRLDEMFDMVQEQYEDGH